MTATLLILIAAVIMRTCQGAAIKKNNPPHIIFMMADDMGWNDVGFHGSDQISTPNIDALAYNGVILNNHYTLPLCTPSRAALLTGKFPIHTGMQHLVIGETEPWGLGLNETILPQRLSKAGYRTHAVGKWHLGFFKKEYTPTFRGFETHYGYYQGFQDYYNHSVVATCESNNCNETLDGYDMRRNLKIDYSAIGKYSTDIFTDEAINIIDNHNVQQPLFLYLSHLAPHTGCERDPFQAPDDVVAKYNYIEDPERRVYAAMVEKLDESVGRIVAALKAKSMLDNSVIVFISDNGAPSIGVHANRGSNYPLRGQKATGWEGGNRGVAAVWSPLINIPRRVSNQMMHIVDWLPTLSALAGLDISKFGVDGLNVWESISKDLPSPRTEFVYNIDTIANYYAAVRRNNWKYLTGAGTRFNSWMGETGRQTIDEKYINKVLKSEVSATLTGYIINKQILQIIEERKAANSATPEKDKREWKLLDEDTILQLRQTAEVKCNETDKEIDEKYICDPLKSPCLFDLDEDPCERFNLAIEEPLILKDLEQLLASYKSTQLPWRFQPQDPLANPVLYNNTWIPWQDPVDDTADGNKVSPALDFLSKYYLLIIVIGVIIIAFACVLTLIITISKYLFKRNKVLPITNPDGGTYQERY